MPEGHAFHRLTRVRWQRGSPPDPTSIGGIGLGQSVARRPSETFGCVCCCWQHSLLHWIPMPQSQTSTVNCHMRRQVFRAGPCITNDYLNAIR